MIRYTSITTCVAVHLANLTKIIAVLLSNFIDTCLIYLHI